MTDLDALIEQVAASAFNYDHGPEMNALYGARAMLAKLRELGLVVEWRPIEEASREVDGHFACPCAIGSTKLGSGSHVGPIVLQATGEWEFTELDYDVFPSATHFAKLPKGPGHD